MGYVTKEQFRETIEKSKVDNRTPEQKARAKEFSKKMKALSYEEHRAIRRKLDEEDGFM